MRDALAAPLIRHYLSRFTTMISLISRLKKRLVSRAVSA
jgi:hypothetical protein